MQENIRRKNVSIKCTISLISLTVFDSVLRMLKKVFICLKITMISIQIGTEVAREETDPGREETMKAVISLHLAKIRIKRATKVTHIGVIIGLKRTSQVRIAMEVVDRVMVGRILVIVGKTTTIMTSRRLVPIMQGVMLCSITISIKMIEKIIEDSIVMIVTPRRLPSTIKCGINKIAIKSIV